MKCTKCGDKLTESNTTHGAGIDCRVKWCDTCWARFWASSPQSLLQVVVAADLVAAARSRNRDMAIYHRFYDGQAKTLAQWTWDGPPPVGLVLGDLIRVNTYS